MRADLLSLAPADTLNGARAASTVGRAVEENLAARLLLFSKPKDTSGGDVGVRRRARAIEGTHAVAQLNIVALLLEVKPCGGALLEAFQVNMSGPALAGGDKRVRRAV